MAQPINVGDSVLARRDGNDVPGVVMEVKENQVLVRLSEPYVIETHQLQGGEIWFPLEYVSRILDDSDATPELPG